MTNEQEASRPAPLRITAASVRKTMALRKLELHEAVSWLINEWHRSHTPEAAMAIWEKALVHARHTASVSRPAGMAYDEAREFLEDYLTRIIVRWYRGELQQYPNVESAYFASAVHCPVKLHRAWMSPRRNVRAELDDWIYDLVPDGRPDATAEDDLLDEIPDGPIRQAALLMLRGIPADDLADHIGKRASRKAIAYLQEFLLRRRLPTGAFPRVHRYRSVRSYVIDGDYDHPMRGIDAAATIGVSYNSLHRAVKLGKTEVRGHSIVQVEGLTEYKTGVHTPTHQRKPSARKKPRRPAHRGQPWKPVARIGADGTETKYESLKAASMGTPGACPCHIAKVCNGKRRTAGGFKWRWLTDNKCSKCNHQHNNQKRPVVRIGQDGVETVYDSLTAAARDNSASLANIWLVCNGKQRTSAGFRWRWL